MATELEVIEIRAALRSWDECDQRINALNTFIDKISRLEAGKLGFAQVGWSCHTDVPSSIQAAILDTAKSLALSEISKLSKAMKAIDIIASPAEGAKDGSTSDQQ